jgi:hypothetical protein
VRLRFRNSGNSGNDRAYVDNILFEGQGYAPSPTPNALTTKEPSPSPPPFGTVSLSNFRLKEYWQTGHYWQEENVERKWCMRCRNDGCQTDEKLYIFECSDVNVQYFDFVPLSDEFVQIKLKNKDLCFQRGLNNDIFMLGCDDTNSDQLWFPKVGSFDGDSFEISPKDDSDYCITTRHHPKAGEEVELEPCDLARHSDTSKWNRY